ncbi:immune inhibitor A [Microbulbifer halophilus]|uniref:Immune inhibitor A-like metallopeptidase VEG domain-containing protein n=1 Tax=Microbulbifer halophilus TaxID=453963 RepID=A0ABW5E9U7_9GAMM|nr:immune inhibitor A [Microbulbifer halophilus]
MAGEILGFNEGLVVWYADTGYDNNWVGEHPGNAFIGVVDADQHTNTWNDQSGPLPPVGSRFALCRVTTSLSARSCSTGNPGSPTSKSGTHAVCRSLFKKTEHNRFAISSASISCAVS